MLRRIAHQDHQLGTLYNRQTCVIAVSGDRFTHDVFDSEVRTIILGRTSIQHARNARMVHQCQGLTFGLEPGDPFGLVHAGPDPVQGNLATNWLALLCEAHFAQTTDTESHKDVIRPIVSGAATRAGYCAAAQTPNTAAAATIW